MIHKSEPSSRVDTKVPSSQNIRVRQRGRGGGQWQRTRSNIFDRDPLEIRIRLLVDFRTFLARPFEAGACAMTRAFLNALKARAFLRCLVRI